MATLNIEGRKVNVDDSFLQLSPEDQQRTVEDIASQIGVSAQPSVPTQPSNYQAATEDPNWIKNARTLYKEVNKADPKDDYEATTFLKDYLYDFNYRLAGSDKIGLRNTFGVASDIGSFSPEGKQAFLDAQKTFEGFDVTLPGMMEAGERILTDPTSFIGITGFGGLARQGVKTAAKEGVEELAKIGVTQGARKGATAGALEGAAYTAASDLGQQTAQVNAGGQQSIDPLQTIQNTAIGAGVGYGLGGAAGAVGGYFSGRNPTVQAARRIVDDPEKAARGAEITKEIADVQATREGQLGTADINARAKIREGDLKYAVDQLKPDEATRKTLEQAITKAKVLTDEEIAALRATPEGSAIADNVLLLKQMRDMTQPIKSAGGVRRGLREIIDWVPGLPNKMNEAIKRILLSPREQGEDRIAALVSPRSVQIADEVLRLKGSSKATQGRQWLLDQGLKMAQVRRDLRDQQAAMKAASDAAFEQERLARKERAKVRAQEREADAAKRKSEAQARREQQLRDAELRARVRTNTGLGRQQAREEQQAFTQNVRTNTGLGRQQNAEIAKQERSATKGFEDALNAVNAKMRMQQRLDNQRVSELQKADVALARAQAAQVAAKTEEAGALNKALRETRKGISALNSYQKLKERSLAKEAKSYRSRKFTKATSEQPKASTTEAPRAQVSGDASGVRNPIAYQAGTDTLVDIQKRILNAAESYPDKKVGKLLKRAVEDMILAKTDQAKRQDAYNKAADAALEFGPDALDFIDEQLYFLVKKYAGK